MRKVQLEAEVARLERVHAVWRDTRRNLQVERGCTEDEIRRMEGRCAQWAQAEAIVAANPREPFCVQVASGVGSEAFEAFTTRAEAGASVRRIVHAYQSAAAFQRERLRGVVARYGGLDLVVQAHTVFAADLSLALPDGTVLDAVTATTDIGIWQSVHRTVSDIPAMQKRLRGRIAEAHARMRTIDRELVRLERWDGQATYDAASSELRAINTAFAAEEQASTERDPATALPAGAGALDALAPDDVSLAELLLTLAQADRVDDAWVMPLPLIPPAPDSLALMTSAREQELHHAPHGTPSHIIAPDATATVLQPRPFEAVPAPRAATHQPRRPVVPPMEELRQLSLFP